MCYAGAAARLAVRSVQPGRFAAGQAAPQGQLATVMHAVRDDHVPQDLANLHLPSEERQLAIEVRDRERADAGDRLLVDALESRRQRLDRSRPLHVRRPVHHVEPTARDPVAHVRVAFGKMPGKLAQRAAAGIGTEVILRCRKRA